GSRRMALSYDIADRSGRGRIDPTCASVRIVPHAWTPSAHARAKCEASNIGHAISESNRARARAALASGGGDDLLALGAFLRRRSRRGGGGLQDGLRDHEDAEGDDHEVDDVPEERAIGDRVPGRTVRLRREHETELAPRPPRGDQEPDQ